MKTRFVAALLALLLMLSLAACGETEVASVLEQAAEAGISLGEPGEEDDTPRGGTSVRPGSQRRGECSPERGMEGRRLSQRVFRLPLYPSRGRNDDPTP